MGGAGTAPHTPHASRPGGAVALRERSRLPQEAAGFVAAALKHGSARGRRVAVMFALNSASRLLRRRIDAGRAALARAVHRSADVTSVRRGTDASNGRRCLQSRHGAFRVSTQGVIRCA